MLNKVMKPFSLEEYLKDPSRKIVTRDGRPVRIICTDAKGICPVVGLVAYENYELAFNVRKNGRIDGNLDLFFASEKHEVWVNLYKWLGKEYTYHLGNVYNSKAEAENGSSNNNYKYVATIRIEWEE